MHHEEHFCEIILNFGQLFRRCCLKDFSSGALAVLLFGGAEPFIYFFKEGIMGNIHAKLNGIWTNGHKEMSLKDISYQELWQPL